MNFNWKDLLLFMIVVGVILAIHFLVLHQTTGSYFECNCELNNGTYYETQNVTCKSGYFNCYQNCILNGTYINFYDEWKFEKSCNLI